MAETGRQSGQHATRKFCGEIRIFRFIGVGIGFAKLFQISTNFLFRTSYQGWWVGEGGREGERGGGCKYLGQIYRCIVGFLALEFTSSCHFNKSGNLPKRLNLFPIIGVLEMIYANVCSLELYSHMFLWAVLLDSTNEGQVFTDNQRKAVLNVSTDRLRCGSHRSFS